MSAQAAFVAHADFSQDSARCRVVSKMAGENSMQPQSSESIIHHDPRRFCGIAISPIGHADPVPKFGATMLGLDHEPYAAAKRFTLAQDDPESQALTVRQVLPRTDDKVPSVFLGVGMRNAQRSRRHFTSADKWHEPWNIRDFVSPQRQPLGLQRNEYHGATF